MKRAGWDVVKEWKSTVPHTNQTGHTRDKTCGFCF